MCVLVRPVILSAYRRPHSDLSKAPVRFPFTFPSPPPTLYHGTQNSRPKEKRTDGADGEDKEAATACGGVRRFFIINKKNRAEDPLRP